MQAKRPPPTSSEKSEAWLFQQPGQKEDLVLISNLNHPTAVDQSRSYVFDVTTRFLATVALETCTTPAREKMALGGIRRAIEREDCAGRRLSARWLLALTQQIAEAFYWRRNGNEVRRRRNPSFWHPILRQAWATSPGRLMTRDGMIAFICRNRWSEQAVDVKERR